MLHECIYLLRVVISSVSLCQLPTLLSLPATLVDTVSTAALITVSDMTGGYIRPIEEVAEVESMSQSYKALTV